MGVSNHVLPQWLYNMENMVRTNSKVLGRVCKILRGLLPMATRILSPKLQLALCKPSLPPYCNFELADPSLNYPMPDCLKIDTIIP